MGLESALQLLRKIMLGWWRRNLAKGLGKLMNWTSSSWNKLKGTIQVCWDLVSRAYTWEDGSQWKNIETMGGVKEDEYVVTERY